MLGLPKNIVISSNFMSFFFVLQLGPRLPHVQSSPISFSSYNDIFYL